MSGAFQLDPSPFWSPPQPHDPAPAHSILTHTKDGEAGLVGDATGVTIGVDGTIWALFRWVLCECCVNFSWLLGDEKGWRSGQMAWALFGWVLCESRCEFQLVGRRCKGVTIWVDGSTWALFGWILCESRCEFQLVGRRCKGVTIWVDGLTWALFGWVLCESKCELLLFDSALEMV